MHKPPVIFLDFDGPLLPARLHYHEANKDFIFKHTGKSKEQRLNVVFDPTMIFVLNCWIENVGAKIVISSDWILYCDKDEIFQILSKNGLRFEFHDVWCTEKPAGSSREQEISKWLYEYEDKISNYMVIDDDYSVLNSNKIKPGKVLLIDFLNGLLWQQIFQGCEILGITDYNSLVKK